MKGSRSGRRLRAVSEALSAIILIGITISAGYILYRSYTLQMQRTTYGVSQAEKLARSRIAEKIAIVAAYINSSTRTLVVLAFNFGDQDVRIVRILLPALVAGSLTIYTIDTNITLAKRDITTFNVTAPSQYAEYPRGIVVRVVFWTDSGRVYEFDAMAK